MRKFKKDGIYQYDIQFTNEKDAKDFEWIIETGTDEQPCDDRIEIEINDLDKAKQVALGN